MSTLKRSQNRAHALVPGTWCPPSHLRPPFGDTFFLFLFLVLIFLVLIFLVGIFVVLSYPRYVGILLASYLDYFAIIFGFLCPQSVTTEFVRVLVVCLG